MSASDWLASVWTVLVAAGTLITAIVASGHAILFKRDTRATVLWVSFIWLVPLGGPFFYLLLGINRIKRRAVLLRRSAPRLDRPGSDPAAIAEAPLPALIEARPNFKRLAMLVSRVVNLPLVGGNRVQAYAGGDEAYPAMIGAIREAGSSIALCTYIFDRDRAGLEFVEALRGAVARGVIVKVLIDDSGARYSFPSVVGKLRSAGVHVARFLPTLAPFKIFALNMRNHRKILLVDGAVGFTGGMNIREGNRRAPDGTLRIMDTHFRVDGPIVDHMRQVFADDWLFTTGEVLEGSVWFPELKPMGEVYARGIGDGPDESLDPMRWTILGALASAHERVCIATPYFLPDAPLISALNTAALRGVRVDIVLPEKNNLPFVHWACVAHLWQMLECGCRVHYSPGGFDHSKLMVVDGIWSMIGSANWDPRSLRLNFEFDLECYSEVFAAAMTERFDHRLAHSRSISLEQVNSRSLAVRLRDGVARLATPFL